MIPSIQLFEFSILDLLHLLHLNIVYSLNAHTPGGYKFYLKNYFITYYNMELISESIQNQNKTPKHILDSVNKYQKNNKDKRRRIHFLIRNQKWADADMYTPAHASFYLLW